MADMYIIPFGCIIKARVNFHIYPVCCRITWWIQYEQKRGLIFFHSKTWMENNLPSSIFFFVTCNSAIPLWKSLYLIQVHYKPVSLLKEQTDTTFSWALFARFVLHFATNFLQKYPISKKSFISNSTNECLSNSTFAFIYFHNWLQFCAIWKKNQIFSSKFDILKQKGEKKTLI